MLTKKAEYGYIVWLTEEEKGCLSVLQEIERLKAIDKVAVLYSGNQDILKVFEKLLQQNKSLIDN